MASNTRVEVLGAKEAVRSLNKLEPGLRKQFAVEAQSIAQPAIAEAQRRYAYFAWGSARLRGVAYNWTDSKSGRKLFPFDIAKANKGVKIKLEGDRRRTAVILLEQRDPATAVLESAGRANQNRLGDSLGSLSAGHTRVLGPALFSKREEVSSALEKQMLEVVNRVNQELK